MVRFLRVIVFCSSPLLSGCIPSSPTSTPNLSRSHYVVALPSVEKKDFLLSAATGLFTDKNGVALRVYLTKLDQQPDVVRVRLIPFSKSAENLTNVLIAGRLTRFSPPYEVGQPGLSTAVHPETVRAETLRYSVRFDGCRPAHGIVKFGCAVAVNRAMSLANIQELEVGRRLSLASGSLGAIPVKRLMEGKTVSLPKREN